MSAYIRGTTGNFDVSNFGFNPGDGYVRNGPETDGQWVCGEIPEDGLIATSGCNGLMQCETEISPIPCIDEVSPCKDSCYASQSSDSTGDSITAEEVTALIAEQVPALATAAVQAEAPAVFDQCVADAAALKSEGA